MELDFENQVQQLAEKYSEKDDLRTAFLAGVEVSNGMEGFAIQQFRKFVEEGFRRNESGITSFDRLQAAGGIAKESGELLDLAMGEVFHGKKHDRIKNSLEIADSFWYMIAYLKVQGFSFIDVINACVTKLKSRYPDGQREALVFKDDKSEYDNVKKILDKN